MGFLFSPVTHASPCQKKTQGVNECGIIPPAVHPKEALDKLNGKERMDLLV